MPPPAIAILYGVLAAALGLVSYVFAPEDQRSPTALFGLVAGVVVLALGAISFARPSWRRHLMHAASVVLLLVLLGTGWRLILALGATGREWATWFLGAYFVLSLLALGVMVHSFIQARRARRAEAAVPSRES